MKKSIFTIACLIAGLFLTVSCEEQFKEEGGNRVLAKDEIAFTIGKTVTKSGEDLKEVQGATIPLGVKTEEGELSLIETIETLDCAPAFIPAPATKGTPAYTENVATLYGSFDARVYGDPEIPNAVFTPGSGNTWTYTYSINPWATSNPIHYWMNMPVKADLAGVELDSSSEDCLSYNGTSITFGYESPMTAAEQVDILFTSKVISREDHDAGRNNHLLFYHALTGVKFAIGNKANSTYITKVEISGLYGTGKCTVTPNYVDNVNTSAGNPSNAEGLDPTRSAACVSWSGLGKLENAFSQEFATTDVTSFSKTDKGSYDFADSFYEAATADNLNDKNASATFWFIPQTLTNDVKLKVTFTVAGETHEQVIDFGQKLNRPTWKAGELRTYTLTSNFVDVDIDDTLTGTDNSKKEEVVITNTGNTNAYLRAVIIGNWYDKDGKIVNVPWNKDDTGFGTFVSAVAASGDGKWELEEDGFWYYTKPVQPGYASNTALFKSYTKNTCAAYPSAQLRLTIAVQAVQSSKIADAKALGWDPGDKQAANTEPETPTALK